VPPFLKFILLIIKSNGVLAASHKCVPQTQRVTLTARRPQGKALERPEASSTLDKERL